jgi:sedoheptulose-bisphosphatase
MTLPEYLSLTNPPLAKTILALADSVREIDKKIRTADISKSGTQNSFGEDQLALDVLADKIIFENLKKTEAVAVAASEETAEETKISDKGEFAVGFDPLDGSSLVDVNLAVGTIFGIWTGQTFAEKTGAEMVAAGYAVYGPRTTFVITHEAEPSEFTLQSDGTFFRTRTKLKITEGKMFAPGNLRACADSPEYKKLVDFWIKEKYTLRYSGGMVPDVNQILLKGKGVFSYPAPAKLRLVFECAPLAKVVEAAGGASSDGRQSILASRINALDECVPVCLGSRDEVERFENFEC